MIILNTISSEAPQILQILDSTPLALWRGVGGEAFPPLRGVEGVHRLGGA